MGGYHSEGWVVWLSYIRFGPRGGMYGLVMIGLIVVISQPTYTGGGRFAGVFTLIHDKLPFKNLL